MHMFKSKKKDVPEGADSRKPFLDLFECTGGIVMFLLENRSKDVTPGEKNENITTALTHTISPKIKDKCTKGLTKVFLSNYSGARKLFKIAAIKKSERE